MSPRLVLKVASQTDVAAMHGGGAVLNKTTRLVDPVAGGHVAAAACVVVNVVVVVDVPVVVVGVLVDFEAELFTRSTMPTMARATTRPPIPRLVLRLLFRPFSMTACFCSRAARCRALFSVGTDRKAT
jgi:hypothetical protein